MKPKLLNNLKITAIEFALLSLGIFFGIDQSLSSVAQEINIGVPLVEEALNITENEKPFAQVISAATTQTLLKRSQIKKSGIEMQLVDSFNSSMDGKTMDLRLRSGASFINSKLIELEDITASLNRCASKPGSKFSSKFSLPPKLNVFTKERRVRISVSSSDGQEAILSFLESCPIYEERSLRLFSKDLGSANLLIGTGAYQLVSRIKNREGRLERTSKQNAWASVIIVRGFANPEQALSALRAGTVDISYAIDEAVLTKAKNDPTLRIDSCGVYNIILRKGLEFSCTPLLDPGSLKYSTL